MALKKITVQECDNPSCGKHYEHSKDQPADGIHLKGVVRFGGVEKITVYACSFECLGPATQAVST